MTYEKLRYLLSTESSAYIYCERKEPEVMRRVARALIDMGFAPYPGGVAEGLLEGEQDTWGSDSLVIRYGFICANNHHIGEMIPYEHFLALVGEYQEQDDSMCKYEVDINSYLTEVCE